MNSYVYREGDDLDSVYIVKKGILKVTKKLQKENDTT